MNTLNNNFTVLLNGLNISLSSSYTSSQLNAMQDRGICLSVALNAIAETYNISTNNYVISKADRLSDNSTTYIIIIDNANYEAIVIKEY